MLKFKEMKVSSSKFREKNDCVVIALAIASGKPYDEVHAILKRHGRKDRRGAFYGTIFNAVKEVSPKAIHNCIRKPCGGQYTPRTIGKALPKGNYVVLFNRHAAAMVDGVIEDWSKGRRMRVERVIAL